MIRKIIQRFLKKKCESCGKNISDSFLPNELGKICEKCFRKKVTEANNSDEFYFPSMNDTNFSSIQALAKILLGDQYEEYYEHYMLYKDNMPEFLRQELDIHYDMLWEYRYQWVDDQAEAFMWIFALTKDITDYIDWANDDCGAIGELINQNLKRLGLPQLPSDTEEKIEDELSATDLERKEYIPKKLKMYASQVKRLGGYLINVESKNDSFAPFVILETSYKAITQNDFSQFCTDY